MKRIIVAASLIAFAGTAALAQNLDVIKERRQAMRAVANASFPNFKMMKGDSPFDLAAVQKNIQAMEAAAAKFKDQFPDNSKTGGGTDASPKIWEQKAQFNAAVDTWIADLKTASQAIKDEATFKSSYPKVVEGCSACHKSADGFTISLGESFKKPQP